MRYTAIITGNLCEPETRWKWFRKQKIIIQPAPFFFTE